MKSKKHLNHIVLFLLSGCATSPFVVPDNHPANPLAVGNSGDMATTHLQPDPDTQRTATLLKGREKQAKDASGEALNSTPSPVPASSPKTKYDMEQMTMPMDR